MMAVAHALVGAAVGHVIGDRRVALAAGVGSHLVGDLIPHRDYPLPVELPLLLGALALLACRHGSFSPAFWGAIGGVLPDIENGLHLLGVIPERAKVFPTHSGLFPHGRPIRSIVNQLFLAGAALWLLRAARPR